MPSSGSDPYRRVARLYDPIFGRMNAGLRGMGLKMFSPWEGMAVLDVGCGTGIQLASYQEAGCRVSGIDASPSMLELARLRLGQAADLQLGDAAHMPYPDQHFDLTILATVLHEMAPQVRAAALTEIKRVLRPDGRLLVIDFESGSVQPLRGWITKLVIATSEAAAGKTHHHNYRDFIAHGGVAALLEDHEFTVHQRRIVSGGAIGLYLALTQAVHVDRPDGAVL